MPTTDGLGMFRPIPLIRNSERKSFKNCQQQWFWRWVQNLVPAMPRFRAVDFGSLWHLIMAHYYCPPGAKDGFSRATAEELHTLCDELFKGVYQVIPIGEYSEETEREWVDARALMHIMIDGYLEKHKGDPYWEVLMPEQRFKAKIPFNERQSKRSYSHWLSIGLNDRVFIAELVGTFDMPIRDHSDNHIKIIDHKTAAAYDAVLSYLVKDDQAGTYIAIGTQTLRKLELIKPDEAITGMIFNFARKQKPPDPAKVDEQGRVRNQPLKRHFIETFDGVAQFNTKWTLEQMKTFAENVKTVVHGDVSKNQPPPLFWRETVLRNKANRLRQISRIADDVEQMATIREGLLGITKNPDKHCAWCDFKDLCDIDENGGDTEQFIKDVYKIDDPYADHQIGATNSKILERKSL